MGTMNDPETALAAIRAAGDDFQSLLEAIKKADFLDAMPGDHRQAYRAAKTKLKKIHLAAKKKAEEDAKKGIVTKVRGCFRSFFGFPPTSRPTPLTAFPPMPTPLPVLRRRRTMTWTSTGLS